MKMRKILVLALKGGTGKSTVTARLGLALKDKGFKIGYLDCDLSGATLPTALGIPEPFPHPEVDVQRNKMSPIKVNGYEIFSLAFRFGRAALLWEGGEQTVEAFGQKFTLRGTGRWQLVKRMLSNVEFGELDYLLLDLPPQSGDEVLSLFENLKDIWGAILVCQPTNLATEDVDRALNMIEVKRIPLLGMVGNMTETICPQCGRAFSPFLDAGVDLDDFCKRRGIPYLCSIPLTRSQLVLGRIFSLLAQKVLQIEPVRIWEKSFKERLEIATLKGVIKAKFKE
jgi:ATP-binding protein involved in chromosome partitioning